MTRRLIVLAVLTLMGIYGCALAPGNSKPQTRPALWSTPEFLNAEVEINGTLVPLNKIDNKTWQKECYDCHGQAWNLKDKKDKPQPECHKCHAKAYRLKIPGLRF